jgi:hypothetical protein
MGRLGGVVTIRAWVGDRSHSRRVGNEIGVGIVLREEWRSRSEPMLYSDKRVLTSSSVTIYFVLPTGCDARSLS